MTVMQSMRLRTGALILGLSLALAGPLRAGSVEVQGDLLASNLTGTAVTIGGQTITALPTVEIGTILLTNDAASVTFASIPANYRYLELMYCARSTRPDWTGDGLNWQANGDTATNYRSLSAWFTTAASCGPSEGDTSGRAGYVQSASITSSAWGMGWATWINYAATNCWKNSLGLAVLAVAPDGNVSGTNAVSVVGGTWKNQEAITSLTLISRNGYNLSAGSRFTLYGGN